MRKLAQQSLKRLHDNAIHAIKQKTASGARNASPYEAAKNALKEIWKSTFGQAGQAGGHREPAFAYEYARLPRSSRPFHPAEYLKNHPSSRRYLSSRSGPSKTSVANNPLVASRLRPSINSSLRGPSVVSNLGIGSSRNFSSHGAGKVFSEINRNVPVGMRALADKLRELDDDARRKKQSAGHLRAQIAKGGQVGKALKRHEKAMGIRGSRWSASASRAIARAQKQQLSAEFNEYFPAPSAVKIAQESTVTAETSEAMDGNVTTYLLVPLCPSLAHLVSGDPSSSPHDEIPATPSLLRQVLPMHVAFDRHIRLRVTPLLLRLQGHGVLDMSPEVWLADEHRTRDGRMEVIFAPGEDGESVPDALRITFEGRTVDQVRAMMGLGSHDEEWAHLYSVPNVGRASNVVKDSVSAALQMPSLDRSGSATSPDALFNVEFSDHGVWSTASDDAESARPELSSLWLAGEQTIWDNESESSSPPWSDSEVELDLLSGSEFSDEETTSVW